MTSAIFRICTLVTDWKQYDRMKSSFVSAGFDDRRCSYSAFDNTNGNHFEPYSLINQLMVETAEPYIILCHQDVMPDQGHGVAELLSAIDELARLDKHWAVAGNAGCTDKFDFVLRLVDPNRFPVWQGPLPLRVNSLDENFLVMRTGSGVRASRSLSGFHLYGTDICVNARLSGKHCYVIDFMLTHLSPGHFGEDFFSVRRSFIERWRSEFNFLYLVRNAEIFVSRWRWVQKIGPKARVKRLLMKTGLLQWLMAWELRPRAYAEI